MDQGGGGLSVNVPKASNMMYEWTKVAVGSLLSAVFAVPLVTLTRSRQLWEEPMAVLAGSLSLASLFCGLVLAAAGVYDLADLQRPGVCLAIQSSGAGLGVAMKLAYVSMAVDQFVAVSRPLQHYEVMSRALRWLLLTIGLGGTIMFSVGVVTGALGLETTADRVQRGASNASSAAGYTGCRWENTFTHVTTVTAEMAVLLSSLVTAALFVYTGVVGWRTKAALLRMVRLQHRRQDIRHQHQSFFDNFKAFKRICLVVSLTVVLDIIGPLVRLAERWYPMPTVSGYIHQGRMLGFIFEGWAYGLLNAKMRAAYRRTLCWCSCWTSQNTAPLTPAPGIEGAERARQEWGPAAEGRECSNVAAKRMPEIQPEQVLSIHSLQQEHEAAVQHQGPEMPVRQEQEQTNVACLKQVEEASVVAHQKGNDTPAESHEQRNLQHQQHQDMAAQRHSDQDMAAQHHSDQDMAAQSHSDKDLVTQRHSNQDMTVQRHSDQDVAVQHQNDQDIAAQPERPGYGSTAS